MAIETDTPMHNGQNLEDESTVSSTVRADLTDPIGNGISKTSTTENNNTAESDGTSNREVIHEDLDNTPWAIRIANKQHVETRVARNGSVEKPTTRIMEGEKNVKVVEKTRKTQKKKLKESSDNDEEYSPDKKKSKVSNLSNNNKKVVVKNEVKEEIEVTSTKMHKKTKSTKVEIKEEASSSGTAVKRRKKVEEEEEIWKWWEEQSPEKSDGTIKWRTLEHKGPLFAPEYVPLPKSVKFKYDGKELELSPPTEEVAYFYAKMLGHDYTSKPIFNLNFFKDWCKIMNRAESEKITDLNKCDFSEMHSHFLSETEMRKARSKEEKKAEKEEKDKIAKEYGFALLDGYKQKIGNFRIEPPGLFRGRGEHPKMGCLKRRVQPEDVIINCSKGVNIPTPKGHKWKEIRHDNTVTWLCSWTENVLGSNKYIMLNPSSKLKGQKDWDKFEKARKLKGYVGQIREQYNIDFKCKEMRIRQRAVALYFIDKLALRAGNEKDTEEAADTVGCCSLRCEHIKLHDAMDGQKYVVEFDFLGKDSIRYYNRVPVEKAVFKNLKLFMEGKEGNDDLFDRLDTSSLNAYLKELMDGLTAKVFRTYNASITLQEQLDKLTNPDDSIHEKLLSYNRANRQVAILCNHQRAIPKSHEKSMENLENKINEKKKEYKEVRAELKANSENEKLQKKYKRVKEQLEKLKTQRTDKDENKQIALGTSKLNYLDPRITVAWCKKYEVPIEKIFSKTHREKFRWAIDMAKEDFVF